MPTMTRENPQFPGGPVKAEVHPDEVGIWQQHGWKLAEDKPEEIPSGKPEVERATSRRRSRAS